MLLLPHILYCCCLYAATPCNLHADVETAACKLCHPPNTYAALALPAACNQAVFAPAEPGVPAWSLAPTSPHHHHGHGRDHGHGHGRRGLHGHRGLRDRQSHGQSRRGHRRARPLVRVRRPSARTHIHVFRQVGQSARPQRAAQGRASDALGCSMAGCQPASARFLSPRTQGKGCQGIRPPASGDGGMLLPPRGPCSRLLQPTMCRALRCSQERGRASSDPPVSRCVPGCTFSALRQLRAPFVFWIQSKASWLLQGCIQAPPAPPARARFFGRPNTASPAAQTLSSIASSITDHGSSCWK